MPLDRGDPRDVDVDVAGAVRGEAGRIDKRELHTTLETVEARGLDLEGEDERDDEEVGEVERHREAHAVPDVHLGRVEADGDAEDDRERYVQPLAELEGHALA